MQKLKTDLTLSLSLSLSALGTPLPILTLPRLFWLTGYNTFKYFNSLAGDCLLHNKRNMECNICFEKFQSSGRRLPRTLPCGHTFCSFDLKRLLDDNKIKCPTCRKESTRSEEDFVVNYQLVSLISELENKRDSTPVADEQQQSHESYDGGSQNKRSSRHSHSNYNNNNSRRGDSGFLQLCRRFRSVNSDSTIIVDSNQDIEVVVAELYSDDDSDTHRSSISHRRCKGKRGEKYNKRDHHQTRNKTDDASSPDSRRGMREADVNKSSRHHSCGRHNKNKRNHCFGKRRIEHE